jgi:hypothetical protein
MQKGIGKVPIPFLLQSKVHQRCQTPLVHKQQKSGMIQRSLAVSFLKGERT